MASFPGSIYSPTNPVSTNPRTSPSVSAEVAGLNDEIIAVETFLGTNGSNLYGGVQFFSYAGDPNGHVTTSVKGSICVDKSTPAIYQATATGNSSWTLVGGSSGSGFALDVFGGIAPNESSPIPYLLNLGYQEFAVAVDLVGATYGTFSENAAIPPVTYPSGTVFTIQSFGSNNGLPADAAVTMTISTAFIVFDAPGANYMYLAPNHVVTLNPGDGPASQDPLGADYTGATVGSDLTYDTSTGIISSAAGGTYSIAFLLSGLVNPA